MPRNGSKTADAPPVEVQENGDVDVLPRPDTLEAETLPRTPLEQTLPCRITPEEKAEAAQKMAQAYGDLLDTQARKKEAAAQYKAEEEALGGQTNRFSQTVRSEFEHRPVACERVIDYKTGEARTYRKDTGEIINIRELTPSEMQTKMELEEAETSEESEEPVAA